MAIHSKSVLAAALAVFAFEVSASAQTNRIGGVVRDETGGTIRGAIVRAATGGTGTAGAPVSLTTATDDRGRFVFVISRSGEWRLTFEAPGFQSMTMPLGMRLTGPSPNLDIKLERQETPEAFGALAGVDSKSLSGQLAAAAALYDEGRFDQALASYREIKGRAPALTLVNLQIGNIYLTRKSYGEAEAAFQEILKSDAEDANGLFAMGSLREAQGNVNEAQSWFQKAALADVVWTRPLMRLASIANAAGDRATASKHLTRIIDLDPASADAQQATAMLKQ
jgi:Carboxypeptidase regulatory-like domain/Tetratricopeptide repeat